MLIGRTEDTLRETQELVRTYDTTAAVFAASVTDEERVNNIAETTGAWDVLILNAGYGSPPASIVQSPLAEYWGNYETNVKSIIIAAQAFVPNAKAGAALYAISSGALALPVKYIPYLSGYISSKVAQGKVLEYLAAENPDLFVCSVHPGLVDTKIFRASGANPDQLPMDTGTLFVNLIVSIITDHKK